MKRCLWLCGAVCLSVCACGSASNSANVGAAGAPGSAGASNTAGAPASSAGAGNSSSGASGASAGNGGSADQCPELPLPDPSGSSGVTLPVEIFGAGTPLTTGQVVTPATGTPYKLSLLKLYFSSPVLLKSDGTRVPAQLVQPNATPLPYGITLVDLDVPASQSLTLTAPAGDYSGLELGVGLPPACNAGDPTKRAFPLNADSDMYWTWGFQYMFIRIEGSRGGEGAWSSFALHVGFQQAYRAVRLIGGIRLIPGGSPKVRLDVDRLLNAPSGADASGADSHEAPDEWVADNAANGALTLVP